MASFDPIVTLKSLLRDELSSYQVIEECDKLRLIHHETQDLATKKYVLQIGLLEEILKDEGAFEKKYFEGLLSNAKANLQAKSRGEQGYRCFLRGCLFSGRRHRQYISHLRKIHTNEDRYICSFKMECKRCFSSIVDLEEHVKAEHFHTPQNLSQNKHSMALDISCKCSLISCGLKRFFSVRELISHMNNDHKMQPRSCIFENCKHYFNAGSESRKHFLTKHVKSNQLKLKICHMEPSIMHLAVSDASYDLQNESQEDGAFEVFENNVHEMEEDSDTDSEDVDDALLFKMSFCDFLNRLSNEKYVSVSTVNIIAKEYYQLSLKAVLRRDQVLKSALVAHSQLDQTTVDAIISDVAANDPFVSAQEDLLTEHRRQLFLSNHFKIVKPVEIVLNANEVRLGGKKDCFHYVPILESIKVLIEDESFNEAIAAQMNEIYDKRTTLRDVKDGGAYKENAYFQENPDAYSILLYSDAVELTNPLGAGRLKHKVVQVFWCLLDIPKQHRSQVDKLQLGLVFKEKLLKKYSLQQVFSRFVADLKILESIGIEVEKPVRRTIKAGILAYAADNLEVREFVRLIRN